MKNDFRFKKIFTCSGAFLIGLFFLFLAPTAKAIDAKPVINDETYAAKFVSQSIADPITMEAGSAQWIKINFKNIGTAVWDNTGKHYISAYTMEPRERSSAFFGSGWASAKQIGKMAGVVKPGATGEYGIFLHAPEKVGDYKEEFYLASENHTWVKGGYFFLQIKVTPKIKIVSAVSNEAVDSVDSTSTLNSWPTDPVYQADRMILSKQKISEKGGQKIDLWLGYLNSGKTNWDGYQLAPDKLTTASGGSTELDLVDESWQDKATVLSKNEAVKAGDAFRIDFVFRTPRLKGEYLATFRLLTAGKLVDTISLPISVNEDAPVYFSNPEPATAVEDVPLLAAEPRIRVGLWQTDGLVQFGSTEDDYNVFDGATLVGVLGKNQLASLRYYEGRYNFSGGNLDFTSDQYIRMAPINNPHAVFELLNYSRVVAWKGAGNYNKYRGALEYRLGEVKSDLWIVNDLLFEDYTRGIAENSNGSPIEYLKAQSVAQRSYAYAIQQSDKYGIFDVVATTGDQLYLGYNSEAQLSNFVTAAEATRGYMVTYNGAVVLTPYFANTDGRTRSWSEVWGGATKPWLVSVTAEYDSGRSKLGHGVGMSQLDASARAKAEGLTWQELVKYYYKGIEIERIYD